MNKITVSAPGKLMLLGEHAVVYNHPCLVTAVDKRLYAIVEIINKPEIQLEAADVGIVGYKKPMSEVGKGDVPKGARFVEIAVTNLLRHPDLAKPDLGSRAKGGFRNKFGMTDDSGFKITTKSEFSSQFGFGSSAAVTVCVVKALAELFGLNLSKKETFDFSYKTVLDIQGKGSGFDVVASVFGGTLYFLTGGKVIEQLKVASMPLIVGYSGIEADTVALVNKVKRSFSKKKNSLDGIYDGIEILVDKARDVMVKNDWERFGELMNKNQEYLRELGVSIAKLDNMINAVLYTGAYGAKISGAGGGDCMIAVCSKDNEQVVKDAITRVGGTIVDIATNAEGVRVE